MRSFTLHFDGHPHLKLVKTEFTSIPDTQPLVAELGMAGPGFTWSAAVQALTILVVQHAGWGRADRNSRQPPMIRGGRGTPASSLNNALSRPPDWMTAMFGATPVADLVVWQNRDFKTVEGAPVSLSINDSQLPASRVRVYVRGEPVESPQELALLAERIQRQRWGNLEERPNTPTPPTVRPPGADDKCPESHQMLVGKSRVEIRVDRPFGSMTIEEKMELLEGFRDALGLPAPPEIKGERPGSIILKLELESNAAEQLVALVHQGEFLADRVVDAWLDDPSPPAGMKAQPITPREPLAHRLVNALDGCLFAWEELVVVFKPYVVNLLSQHWNYSSHLRRVTDDEELSQIFSLAYSVMRERVSPPYRMAAQAWTRFVPQDGFTDALFEATVDVLWERYRSDAGRPPDLPEPDEPVVLYDSARFDAGRAPLHPHSTTIPAPLGSIYHTDSSQAHSKAPVSASPEAIRLSGSRACSLSQAVTQDSRPSFAEIVGKLLRLPAILETATNSPGISDAPGGEPHTSHAKFADTVPWQTFTTRESVAKSFCRDHDFELDLLICSALHAIQSEFDEWSFGILWSLATDQGISEMISTLSRDQHRVFTSGLIQSLNVLEAEFGDVIDVEKSKQRIFQRFERCALNNFKE